MYWNMDEVLWLVDQDFLRRLKRMMKAYDKDDELFDQIYKLVRIRDCKIKKASEQLHQTPSEAHRCHDKTTFNLFLPKH